MVQFGFWLTPIFWESSMFPEKYRWVIELNPMYYIVNGYRQSLVQQVPIIENDNFLYFWVLTIFILFLGISVYRRLRPHFAEVI